MCCILKICVVFINIIGFLKEAILKDRTHKTCLRRKKDSDYIPLLVFFKSVLVLSVNLGNNNLIEVSLPPKKVFVLNRKSYRMAKNGTPSGQAKVREGKKITVAEDKF